MFVFLGGSPGGTPEREFADREVSYDEVAAVTTHVRKHSNHLSPVSPPGVLITRTEDVADSVFSMDELTKSGLLTGECIGTGIVSIRGSKGERPLSSHFPLSMPGLNKQSNVSKKSVTFEKIDNLSSEIVCENREIVLERIFGVSKDANTNTKCEDYGFQVINIGHGKETKLQVEPTEEYLVRMCASKDCKKNSVLLPGDQLISINGIEIKSETTDAKQRKRERTGHSRSGPKDQVLNIIRGSEVKETCNLKVL